VIYMSSSMVYGDFNSKEVDEDFHCKPIGIYGTLKYSGELLIKSYNQVFDLPYTIIRPSALYGERCVSRRVGQIFIENAINDQEIKIGGDGEEKLDFTYIKDLCDGVQLAIAKKEAINEAIKDIEEGADIIMVKPGIAYLDIISLLYQNINSPIAAYQVSGEYTMLKTASDKGYLDYNHVMIEQLFAFKRAGASMIVTYHAKDAVKILNQVE